MLYFRFWQNGQGECYYTITSMASSGGKGIFTTGGIDLIVPLVGMACTNRFLCICWFHKSDSDSSQQLCVGILPLTIHQGDRLGVLYSIIHKWCTLAQNGIYRLIECVNIVHYVQYISLITFFLLVNRKVMIAKGINGIILVVVAWNLICVWQLCGLE